jgi:hypothetical protein
MEVRMSAIDHGRLLLGGILAGLIINIGEFIFNVPVAGAAYDAALARLGLAPPGATAISVFVLLCFLLGILAVWLYAAIRPRLGPGVRTAIYAGLFVWLLVSAYPGVGNAVLGLTPPWLVMLTVAWQLFEVTLATVAGAWIYREQATPAAAPTPQRESVPV